MTAATMYGGITIARFHNGDYVDYLTMRQPTRRAVVSYRPERDTYRVRCYGDVSGYGGGWAKDIQYHRKDPRAAFELAIAFVDHGAAADGVPAQGRCVVSDFVPKDTSPIELYMHCTQCLFELPVGTSPAAYSRTQTGITTEGEVLVWCIRHDMLVANLGRTSRLTAGPKCDVPGCACSKVPS